MSTNFPASLDTLSNPAATDGLTGHASQHANANDAIEALQAKVGINGSADPTSLDYRVSAIESGGGGGTWGGITGTLSDQTDLQSALNGKLPTGSTADSIAEGVTNLYFTAQRVRDAVLTGMSTATNAVITATDTVLGALGKLQKQITDNLSTLTTHTGNVSNPHSVTKTQVGLGSVDNTSDANKPVSTAQQTALDLKQDLLGKDASGGYAGLTLFKLNLRNALGTITSWFTTAATAARTWTMPDKSGTVALLDDIPTGGGGAVGGGTDEVFYENDITVTSDYTITTGKNAMSAGPITIADGVAVTIPPGSTWSIVGSDS